MVAEIPGKVSRIEPINPEIVREQIEVLANNFPIAAIKTGLLCSADIISAVVQAIVDLRGKIKQPHLPLVVDPVITATGGDPLLQPDAVTAYKNELFPLATLITPNLDEAAQLGADEIKDRESMRRAGKQLENEFQTAILLKGGHLPGPKAIDLLFANGQVIEFADAFIRDVGTHGTGCTYSAAIASGLASGLSLEPAIKRAKEFVTNCIADRIRWQTLTGQNVDALNHFTR